MIEGGVPFPMLSDAGGRVGSVYGVYDEAAMRDIRGRYIIDPEGVVQALEILNPSVGRKVDEILRQLRACQHVRETGEATPVDWEPGSQTLIGGVDLVGKVKDVWTQGS